MDRYIEAFLNVLKWDAIINVHLFDNKDELHEARIEMTNDALLKEYLLSDKCMHSQGTYIIPPKSDTEYDILLVESELLIYDLWHEMVHTWNYYNATKSGYDYMTMVTEPILHNWDEFQARKLSTIMWFTYLENESGEKYDSQEFFDNLAEILRKEVKEPELVDESVFKYNLMQYLGFVSGVEEICKDFFELPTFIADNPIVLKQYNSLNQK